MLYVGDYDNCIKSIDVPSGYITSLRMQIKNDFSDEGFFYDFNLIQYCCFTNKNVILRFRLESIVMGKNH